MAEKTLALTMIVKNEGPRMVRLLESVKGLIDELVLSDTGSTDNTIEVTRAKCTELGIGFILDETPFKNFGFNRTRSLEVAVERSKCDYLLLLDADMKLVWNPKLPKKELLSTNIDMMSIMQRGCGMEYYNVRIMKRTLKNLRCVGVTHEHYAADGENTMTNIPADALFIDDIGDGGAKADKFPRDYRLLKQGLKDEPKNVRYMFYLAETCRHQGKFEEAIIYYKKRFKAGGWDEELYCSLYGIMRAYISLNNADKVDAYAMRAFAFRPSRIEAIYAACKWHRERGENIKAYGFYQLGHRVARPQGDVLFVEMAPYSWGWDYEFAILAYYVEKPNLQYFKQPLGNSRCLRQIIASLGTMSNRDKLIPGFAFDNMIDNVKHYVELLPSSFPRTDMQPNQIPTFTSSTPGVVRLVDRGVVRHARQVDYKINKTTGCYLLRPDGCVGSTCSIQLEPDQPWKQLMLDGSGINLRAGTLIKGIEDIRLFNMAPTLAPMSSLMSDDEITTRIPENVEEGEYTRVYGLGTTVEYSGDGKSQMVLLEINLDRMVAFPIRRIPRVFDCEKNHAPICGTNFVVHSWGPRLKVYDLLKSSGGDKIEWSHDFGEDVVPGWFRNMRGSSAGIAWPSTGTPREYWFMCHTAVFETPRRYLHNVVRLDAATLRPVGFTIPFSFDDYKIEFVGGMAFDDNDKTLVVGYSVFDECSREIRIPVGWLNQSMMITMQPI
jgi:glycosyltransferase involved in cell wall biosynthesis